MRAAEACVTALLLSCGGHPVAQQRQPPADAAPRTIVVKNLGRPGELAVENRGAARRLRSSVAVERRLDNAWQVMGNMLDMVETCDRSRPEEACTDLRAGAVLTLVPWNGMSCSGQCNEACNLNSYVGPGTFRFVVRSCDGKQRWEGPAFVLPAEPPLPPGRHMSPTR